jgi:hypothetical protein
MDFFLVSKFLVLASLSERVHGLKKSSQWLCLPPVAKNMFPAVLDFLMSCILASEWASVTAIKKLI